MNAPSKLFDTFNQLHTQPVDQAGYMIGEQGDVVKITAAMIKRACVELKARCHVPKQSKR